MPDKTIKNIIFDLGGVILELSVEDTLRAFSQASGRDLKAVKENFIMVPEFELFEKGGLDESGFRNFLRSNYNLQAMDHELDACWNAMLKGIPLENLQLLSRLKQNYRTFLLSNTNGIHLDFINKNILTPLTGENNLDRYFHKAYYSHWMGKRKPDPAIFEQVLEENSLKADETLFLDDNELNLKGAEGIGIKTLFITSHNMILDLFND